MGYYSRRGRSSGSTSYGYRSRRRSTYRPRRYTQRRSKVTRKTTRGGKQTKNLRAEVARMKKEQVYGPVRKVVFDGDLPVQLFDRGPRVGEHYFEFPISQGLGPVVQNAGKDRVYLTGVTLEVDVLHQAAAEFFVMCVVQPLSVSPIRMADGAVTVCRTAIIRQVGNEVVEEEGKRELMRVNHPRLSQLGDQVFKYVAHDGSLFGAELVKPGGRYLPVCEPMVNGKKMKSQKGRVALRLTGRGGTVADHEVMAKVVIRVYWPVEKYVQIGRDDEYTLFGGIRPCVEGGSDIKMPAAFGEVRSVRLSFHTRH